MQAQEKVIKLLDKRIFFTTEEAKKKGIHEMLLSRMVKQGELYRTERGVYAKNFEWLTDPLKKYLPACTLYPKAVISGISALSYYDLTDEEERKIWVTVPISQVIRNPRYQITRATGSAYSLGIQRFKLGSRVVRLYNAEKTVVDAFKYQAEEVAFKALKAYLKWKKKDIRKLCDYAKRLRKPLDEQVRLLLADE